MKLKWEDYLRAIGAGVAIFNEVEVDQAELQAGNDVPINVQIGTENGKPLHLRGVLTTK